MKRKTLIIVPILILIIIGFIYQNSIKDRKFSTQKITEKCNTLNDNNFDIGIIGDSWVASKKIDIGLKSKLSSIKNLRIASFGQGGAKSKKIYENLYIDENDNYSSKLVLGGEFDAVIIIAGVNDIGSHIGKDFYSFHMLKIVDQLNECNILPIIISIPEFGIEDSFSDRPLHKKVLKDIPNKIFFDENLSNPRDKYNEELKNLIHEKYSNFMIIEFDDFIADYQESKEMYANHSHLNSEGYERFGEFIGTQILNKIDFVNKNTVANIVYDDHAQQ